MKKMVFFLLLFIIGCGFLTGPYEIIGPGSPGHEITWGMFGITFGDTSNDIGLLIVYCSIFLLVISLVFLVVYFIKKFKK